MQKFSGSWKTDSVCGECGTCEGEAVDGTSELAGARPILLVASSCTHHRWQASSFSRPLRKRCNSLKSAGRLTTCSESESGQNGVPATIKGFKANEFPN